MYKLFKLKFYALTIFTISNCSAQKRNKDYINDSIINIDKTLQKQFNKTYTSLGYFKCNNLDIKVESYQGNIELKYFLNINNSEQILFYSSNEIYGNLKSNAKLLMKNGKYYIERKASERKIFGINYPRHNTLYEIIFINNELILKNTNSEDYCEKYIPYN